MAHPSDKLIRRYVGRQLTRREVEAVEAHLRRCPACRREVATYLAIDQVVAALPEPEWLPEALLVEVADRVRQPRTPERWLNWRRWVAAPVSWRWATAAATLIVMLGAALYVGNMRFWQGLERDNRTFYAEHYSFITTPQATPVAAVNLVDRP